MAGITELTMQLYDAVLRILPSSGSIGQQRLTELCKYRICSPHLLNVTGRSIMVDTQYLVVVFAFCRASLNLQCSFMMQCCASSLHLAALGRAWRLLSSVMLCNIFM
jgi:hypothetical protein